MKKGITPVIAIVLLLLLVVSMAGGMYFFYQAYNESSEEAGDDAVILALKDSKTDINIKNAKDGVLYIRNVGDEEIATTYLALYVENKPVTFTAADATLAPGETTSLSITQNPDCQEEFCKLKLTGAAESISSVEKEELGCQSLSSPSISTASTSADYNELPSVSSGTSYTGITWEYDGAPGGDDDIWYRRITGGTLPTVVEVTTDDAGGIDDRNPAFTYIGDTAYFAWRRNNPSFQINTTNYTSSISTNETIPSSGIVGSLDIAPYGTSANVVFSDIASGDYDLYFSSGPSYSAPTQLTNTNYWEINPKIAYGDSDAIIIYQANTTGTDYDIQYIKGPTWQSAVNLTATSVEEQNPDIDFYGDKAMAVWQQDDGGDDEIYYSIYERNSFSTPAKVTALAGDDFRPAVSWITQNRAAVFFTHDDGSDYEIYMAEYSSGSWTVTQITDNAFTDDNSDVDFNSACRGIAAWDADDTGNKIKYILFN